MSNKAVEWALRQSSLAGKCHVTLIMLADCINRDDQFAFPSRERICSVVGLKERQVIYHLRTLEKLGLILCRQGRGQGRGKGRKGTHYYLACDPKTGEPRPIDAKLTTGNQLPVVDVLTGCNSLHTVPVTGCNPVQSVMLTGCNPAPLQGAIQQHSLYIQEPEKEPEPSSREREANHHLLSPGEPATPPGKGSGKAPGNGAYKSQAAPKLDGKRAIALFNEAAERRGWCVAKGTPSPQRKAAIAARLREHGMDGWIAQLALAERMPFLRGENERGWRMGLDYFARPSGWAKIAEGGFRTEGAKPKSRFSADNPPPGYRFGGYGEDGAARYLRDESKNFYR